MHEVAITRARALAVDDHPVNRLLISRQLDVLGFDVDVAADGAQALERFAKAQYGVVTLDCAMPGMDGYAVARRMRAFEAQSMRPRSFIVACTADSDKDGERRCVAAGMDAFVPKPGSTQLFAACFARLPGWKVPSVHAVRAPRIASEVSPTETPPVDLDVIAASFGTDAVGSHAMLRDFVAINAEDVQSLNAAVGDRDAPAVARHAHRVLGASKMVGALALARVAARLEALAATCDWRRITAVAAVLITECRRVESFVAEASYPAGRLDSK